MSFVAKDIYLNWIGSQNQNKCCCQYLSKIFVDCCKYICQLLQRYLSIVAEDICLITNDLDLNQNKEAMFSTQALSFSDDTNLFSWNISTRNHLHILMQNNFIWRTYFLSRLFRKYFFDTTASPSIQSTFSTTVLHPNLACYYFGLWLMLMVVTRFSWV